MKCPHCFLELRIISQYNKEIDQCPKCEGIWLDPDTTENIFDFTEDGDEKIKLVNDFQDSEDTIDQNPDNKLQKDYYYYKKPFKKNEKIDDMFDFE
jgi:Zn-finger nucleic acid-binding protein